MNVVRPSFIKPLTEENYTTVLRLPLDFVVKHKNLLPEKSELRISSGKIWTVKIDKTDDDNKCFFTVGWSDFVKDLGLQRVQVLVFWLNADDGTFDVSIYNADSNERELSAEGSISFIVMVESDIEESESDDSSPRFQFALTKSRRSRMVVQRKFAKESGLIGKTSVILQYVGRERCWKVALRQRHSLELGRGWNKFRVGNNLEFGRIYSFEFIFAKNLILVSDCNSTSETTNLHPSRVWRYVKELKENHFSLSRLGMPKTFVTGIGIATGDNINLEDSQGSKKWTVTIKDQGRGAFIMARGLKVFFRENQLQVGDILLFEFVPNSVDNVVKFVVMENEAGKEMIVRSGKGGIIMT